MKSFFLRIILLTCITGITGFSVNISYAAWPSVYQVLDELAPITGMNPDQISATKFYLEKPECASTIMSYTLAQDYSLIGFIGSLKTAKLDSFSKL